MSNKHIGSSLDDFLKSEGTFEQAQALAINEVVGRQLTQEVEINSLGNVRPAQVPPTVQADQAPVVNNTSITDQLAFGAHRN